MAIYKRCGRCGKRIESGSRCDCRKERHKEYDKYSRDKKSKLFYSGKEWEHARASALEADEGMDVYVFMTTGEMILAEDVHHIIPIRENWDKRTDLDNLISLSHATHAAVEQMYKKNKEQTQEILRKLLKEYREGKAGGV